MTTYNTGNPLGSSHPKDLYDNAENLDRAVNSLSGTWKDRFGRTRPSVQGVTVPTSIVQDAANEANRAEAARDVAMSSSLVFENSSAGQSSSNLSNGDFFWVVSDKNSEVLHLWKKGASAPIDMKKSTASAKIYDGMAEYAGAQVYFGSGNIRSQLYIEETGNAHSGIYLKVQTLRIRQLGDGTKVYNSHLNILADIGQPDIIKTSPNGVEECIQIKESLLIFRRSINKLQVIPVTEELETGDIILAGEAYGRIIQGFFLELGTKADVTALTDAGLAWVREGYRSDVDNYYLYEGDGYPPYKMYFKAFREVNVSTKGGAHLFSWSRLVEQIDDPELFATSPDGVEECLVLSDQTLYFDIITNTLYVRVLNRPKRNAGDLTLISSAYGKAISGLLVTQFDHMKEVRGRRSHDNSTSGASHKVTGRKFVAHGGMNGFNRFAPFGSLIAYHKAGEYGYWGAECDLVETEDNEWVLIHDLVVDNYTYDTGAVNSYTLAELQAMDATKRSAQFGWSNVPLASLDQFLAVCAEYNMTPVMELKSVPDQAGAQKILETVEKHMAITDIVIMSFNVNTVELFRSLRGELRLALLVFSASSADIDRVISIGNCILNVQKTTTPAVLAEAHERGVEIGMWTLTQQDIDSGLSDAAKYLTTDIGVPYNFDKGLYSVVYASGEDFSGISEMGSATVASGVLTLPSGALRHEIPIEYGDVITAVIESKNLAPAAEAKVDISIYNAGGTLITKLTEVTISSNIRGYSYVAAVNYFKDATSCKINILAGAGGMDVYEVKVKKHTV